VPKIVISPRFKRRLNRKTVEQWAAVLKTLSLLAEDERRPGLNVHQVRGATGSPSIETVTTSSCG
jgi:hypothetical protein